MDESVEQRAAANEATFRRVNEGIERGRWPGEENQATAFCCECAQLGCNLLIELSSSQYEQVRAHPNRFIVAPGHESPDVEIVVRREPGYTIVEKTGEAGEKAQDTDPRD